MEPSAIISAYRNTSSEEVLSEARQLFSFRPKGPLGEAGEDENLDFRTELADALLEDFSLADIKLIRELFRAELDCERVIWRHDNLYKLSFYLYSLGQLEDTFILYESKYGPSHMDASTMQDQYFITVGHEPDVVIEYLESRFSENPSLREDYPELISELENIRDEQEYGTIESYTRFIRGYFFGHGNADLSAGA